MQDISKNISGIPARLREVIAKAGLTQAKFAALIDEDLGRLKDVLRGQMRTPADMLQKILARTDVDAVWLVTGQTVDLGELSPAEKVLLSNFRGLAETERDVLRRTVALLANARSNSNEESKNDV